MVARKSPVRFPRTKISETFLRFAAPLSDAAGGGLAKEEFERILKIAFTVWNAAVLVEVNGTNKHVSEVRRLTSGDPIMAAMIEPMIRRTAIEFGDDLRLIGEYTLTQQNGEWRLRAEARVR